jgi:hypothetical protein
LHVLKRWAAWPQGIRWLVGIAAAVLAAAIVWVVLVPAPDWLAHHDVGSVTGPLHETALDNARGRLLTLGAGLLAAAALVFTALNFSLLRRNSEQADQWQRRTHELTEQGQVTDRYTRAIEQLGSDKLDVRIGGIYSLERVARDSSRDHPVIMQVLTAFIREHSREQWPTPDADGPERQRSTRPDVQAAVTVVGRRTFQGWGYMGAVDLTRADLSGARLGGADLNHTILIRTILAKASLQGTNLHYACLLGADLTGANLLGADLTGATLSAADFTGADLSGARLAGADLTGARWPADTPVPEGWERDADSGRLVAGTDSGPAETG